MAEPYEFGVRLKKLKQLQRDVCNASVTREIDRGQEALDVLGKLIRLLIRDEELTQTKESPRCRPSS